MIHGPVRKDGAPVNELAANRTEDARIIGADAMIPHDEIMVLLHAHRPEIALVLILRRNIRLGHNLSVDIDGALADFHRLSWQAHHALDKRFRVIERIPEDDHIAPLNGLEAIDKFVDETAFLDGEQRRHAGAFNFYALVPEDDYHQRQTQGDQQVAGPNPNFS